MELIRVKKKCTVIDLSNCPWPSPMSNIFFKKWIWKFVLTMTDASSICSWDKVRRDRVKLSALVAWLLQSGCLLEQVRWWIELELPRNSDFYREVWWGLTHTRRDKHRVKGYRKKLLLLLLGGCAPPPTVGQRSKRAEYTHIEWRPLSNVLMQAVLRSFVYIHKVEDAPSQAYE